MSQLSRRDFLGQSAVAVGALAASTQLAAAARNERNLKSGVDQVTLGRTGLKLSLIGMGTGSNGVRHSSNQVKLGHEKFIGLVRYAFERGITYFDTADQYGSHIYLRDAFKGLPRHQLFIQSKTRATTAEMAKADIERLREELGVDYLDTLLMHCMVKPSWPSDFRPVMDTLSWAKQKGYVRAIGVSCHGLPPLQAAVHCDWIDVDLARINPIGAIMDADPATVVGVLKEMKTAGKAVVGMKILGQGALRTRQDEAIKFALSVGVLDAFTIGAESIPEQNDLIRRIAAA